MLPASSSDGALAGGVVAASAVVQQAAQKSLRSFTSGERRWASCQGLVCMHACLIGCDLVSSSAHASQGPLSIVCLALLPPSGGKWQGQSEPLSINNSPLVAAVRGQLGQGQRERRDQQPQAGQPAGQRAGRGVAQRAQRSTAERHQLPSFPAGRPPGAAGQGAGEGSCLTGGGDLVVHKAVYIPAPRRPVGATLLLAAPQRYSAGPARAHPESVAAICQPLPASPPHALPTLLNSRPGSSLTMHHGSSSWPRRHAATC